MLLHSGPFPRAASFLLPLGKGQPSGQLMVTIMWHTINLHQSPHTTLGEFEPVASSERDVQYMSSNQGEKAC